MKGYREAFGVLQQKFHIIARPMEQWYVQHIESIVQSCIILHNWMVTLRVANDEEESATFYDLVPDGDARNLPADSDVNVDASSIAAR